MWTKPYGKTGKQVSAVSFGGMRFANPQDIDASAAVVLHAYNKGVNYFDTAPGYCADKSEEITGAAVRQMKPGTFYVSTKCMAADGEELRKSLERSLQRLNVERIDFFHIWCLTSLEAWKERQDGGAVAAAQKAKEEGLIEHLVVSSHLGGEDLSTVLAEGPFEGVLLGYGAVNFPYREAAVQAAGDAGMGVVTMNPLGGGLIPRNAERFHFLRGPQDRSVVEAAIRFNVSHPHITTALVGFSNTEQVDEAVAAVEDFQPYPAEHYEAMREHVLESFDGFCTGCGYCAPCPNGVDIPKMMDTYNQRILTGRQDPKVFAERFKWHWGIALDHPLACSMCGVCEDRCTQHLPIRERMETIQKAMLEVRAQEAK